MVFKGHLRLRSSSSSLLEFALRPFFRPTLKKMLQEGFEAFRLSKSKPTSWTWTLELPQQKASCSWTYGITWLTVSSGQIIHCFAHGGKTRSSAASGGFQAKRPVVKIDSGYTLA